jgi:hypothetical protein
VAEQRAGRHGLSRGGDLPVRHAQQNQVGVRISDLAAAQRAVDAQAAAAQRPRHQTAQTSGADHAGVTDKRRVSARGGGRGAPFQFSHRKRYRSEKV